LLFRLAGNISLQVFGFSCYEVWQIHFPDGSAEYSNYTKQEAPNG
jgi:hypothetical protein